MSNGRPIYAVIAAAFVVGVLVTLAIVLALGSGGDGSPDLSQSAAVKTPTLSPVASATAVLIVTATPVSTLAPGLPPPVQLGVPTPLIPTPTALQRPGVCTMAAEPAYLARSTPALQQLGNAYQAWSTAPITTSAIQMQGLRTLLGNFTLAFDAIAPLPEGCTFIHNSVLQAAKDLSDTAGRGEAYGQPALRGGWEAEYRGHAGNLKNALDLYFSSAMLTISPRPFADVSDRAIP